MTTANQYEVRGLTYQYVHDIPHGPTHMFKCKDCGNHCATSMGVGYHSPEYHCATCDEFWLIKGLAPYKVIQMEIPEEALADA